MKIKKAGIILAGLLFLIALLFEGNTILRGFGIETGIGKGSSSEFFSVCQSATSSQRLLERSTCGIDACSIDIFDFQGKPVRFISMGDGTASELREAETYAADCKKTTSEYFYRFVSPRPDPL